MKAVEVIQAPAPPSLPRAAEYLRTRDRIDDEIARVQGEAEAAIEDLTADLQAKIMAIREDEESRISDKVAELREERSIAEDLYQGEIKRCVSAGVMYDDRYELVKGVIGCRQFISYDEGRLLGQHETRDRLVSIRYHGRRCD